MTEHPNHANQIEKLRSSYWKEIQVHEIEKIKELLYANEESCELALQFLKNRIDGGCEVSLGMLLDIQHWHLWASFNIVGLRDNLKTEDLHVFDSISVNDAYVGYRGRHGIDVTLPPSIRAAQKIESLDLEYAVVGDFPIDALCAMPKLHKIHLAKAKVCGKQVDALMQACPTLDFFF